MRTATGKSEAPRCPIHVGVTMIGSEVEYPKFVGLSLVLGDAKKRTIFKCTVPKCPRVISSALTADELEDAEIMAGEEE